MPAPDASTQLSSAYEAAQGEIEERLAEIWREVLSVERVGRHDNFFELGGDSLLAVKMTAKASERLQLQLPLLALFEAPTVEKLAIRIELARTVGHFESESTHAAGEEAFEEGVI